MLKFIVLSISIFVLLGCDVKQPPSSESDDANLDLIYDALPEYNATTSVAPYDLDKFKDVLDKSKYQYPYDNTMIDYGEFDAYKAANFYADENEDFYLILNKPHNTQKQRSELREGPNSWSTADTRGHFWVAQLRCFKPTPDLQSYTFMQIHGTQDTYNYPILRLLWVRNRVGVYDHIWAIVIISNPDEVKIYEWIDLGPRPDEFFDAAVYVVNNMMEIIINNNVIKTYNVSYWEDVQNYFKTGVYINLFEDGGVGAVAFRELHFLDWADPAYVHLTHY